MRLPPNRVNGKWVAASRLDHRTAGFKLGDGREYQRQAKHVLRGNDKLWYRRFSENNGGGINFVQTGFMLGMLMHGGDENKTVISEVNGND